MGIHDCTDVNNKALNENSGLEKTCFQARNFFCSDRDIKKGVPLNSNLLLTLNLIIAVR